MSQPIENNPPEGLQASQHARIYPDRQKQV